MLLLHGYPPDREPFATSLVIQQAEAMAESENNPVHERPTVLAAARPFHGQNRNPGPRRQHATSSLANM